MRFNLKIKLNLSIEAIIFAYKTTTRRVFKVLLASFGFYQNRNAEGKERKEEEEENSNQAPIELEKN